MKSSYFQTPRTQRECTFCVWADPIELDRRRPAAGRTLCIVAAIVVISITVILIKG